MMIFCDFSPFGPKRWKITKNHHFLRFFRLSSNHQIMSSNVFGMCLGTQRSFWKHLKSFIIDFERKIEKSFKNQKSQKIPKNRIFHEKSDFHKFVYIDFKHEIWSEMVTLDTLDMFYTHIWHQKTSWKKFGKIEKIDFLNPQIGFFRNWNIVFDPKRA